MPEKVNGTKFSEKSNITSLNSSNTPIDSKSAVQLNSTENKLSTLQKMADNSPHSQRFAHFTSMANNSIPKQPVSQLSKDSHSLPDNVKQGVESLSGISMDDVKVHYNSAKPAQLNAHAYAQGTDKHVASGQEKHLPHEAWHVVQQKQGRVRPTTMMKAKVPVNDDQGLEKEADVMGARALQMKPFSLSDYRTGKSVQRKQIIQRAPDFAYPEKEKPEKTVGELIKSFEPENADIEFNEADVYPENDIVKDTENPMRRESSKQNNLEEVTPVSENDNVAEVFRGVLDLIVVEVSKQDAEAALGDTSPEGPKESAKKESGADGKSEEASTQAIETKEEKKKEEETETLIDRVNKLVTHYVSKLTPSNVADGINAAGGNGVVANVSTFSTASKGILDVLEKKHNINAEKFYYYLENQDIVLSHNFTEANRYIALMAVLKDSKDLCLLINEKMAKKENLTDKEKESVNALLNSDIKSKLLDILQGTAYGTPSIVHGILKGAEIAGPAASAVPGLGIAGSGIEFLRGGWKGKKAVERRTRLIEVMQEINALKDEDNPGLAELKSKFNPIKERVNKRIAHNFLRSAGGGLGVAGGVFVVVGAASTAATAVAITGGIILIPAAIIGGVLAARMLYGQIRAKKESRQQLAEYLYETHLQDGGTGDSAKKIVKAIIGKEKYMSLPEEKLIELIARKVKAT